MIERLCKWHIGTRALCYYCSKDMVNIAIGINQVWFSSYSHMDMRRVRIILYLEDAYIREVCASKT